MPIRLKSVANHEHDALVGVLQDERVSLRMHLGHDDVAAFHEPYAVLDVLALDLAQHIGDPRAGGVHQRAGADRARLAADGAKVAVSAPGDHVESVAVKL